LTGVIRGDRLELKIQNAVVSYHKLDLLIPKIKIIYGGKMSKKKAWNFIALLGAVLLILPGASLADDTAQLSQGQANQNGITFGLRLTGGASLLMRNDFNDHLQGLNDFRDESSPFILDSEFEMLKMGMDFGGEILINFMPHFSMGIGAGYLSAGKETTAEYRYWTVDAEMTYHPRFSVIPITLSFYYGIPLGSSMEVVLNAGIGYYIGTVNYDYYYKDVSSGYLYEDEETWSAKSNAFGFHGGIDLEFGISPNLALVLGAKGRYANLTDLTGDLEWEIDTNYGYSDSGTERDLTLWFGDYKYTTEKYPRLLLSENEPSSSWWSDVRKAEVNLSGIVLQAGIKVTF